MGIEQGRVGKHASQHALNFLKAESQKAERREKQMFWSKAKEPPKVEGRINKKNLEFN